MMRRMSESEVKRRKRHIPLRWRIYGIAIIALSLALGLYLKILWIEQAREHRMRLDKPASAEQKQEAEQLNRAVGLGE